MAIDDFEWQGELEVQPRREAKALVAPAGGSWRARVGARLLVLQKSVWLAPALRLGGMALLLGVLAGIGVVATTYAKPGAPLPDGPSSLVDALGTAWLKPTPASSSPEHSARPTGSVSSTPIGNERVPATSAAPTASAEPPSAGPGITVDGKVILNVASADELTKLPGVGQKRALAIVALRTKLKRFRQATDLLRVKGIGPRGLKRMLPHLVLDPPS